MIGKTISRYRIVSQLGGGGMGVVYEAEDLKLRHHVALKFLPTDMEVIPLPANGSSAKPSLRRHSIIRTFVRFTRSTKRTASTSSPWSC
jgi:serine/threonine protein kinase